MAVPNLSKIQRLEAELAAERKKLDEWDKRPDDAQKLAELLHERFCRYNHTDGCSWGYECGSSHPARHDPWEFGFAHKEWLGKARLFLDTAGKIQKTVKGKSGYQLAEALLMEWPSFLR